MFEDLPDELRKDILIRNSILEEVMDKYRMIIDILYLYIATISSRVSP